MVLLINRPLNKTLDYSGLLRVSVLPFIVTQQTGGDDQAAGVRPGDGLELIPPSYLESQVKSLTDQKISDPTKLTLQGL